MTRVYFSRPAEKDIKHLPETVQKYVREEQVKLLKSGLFVGKPLHGPLRGYFSFDFYVSGVSYRIAYEIIKGDVVILMIDTRDNFYQKFSRRVL